MRAKIIQYLEKELSPQDRTAFEEALTQDPDLKKAYLFQKAQWDKLALLRFHAKAAAILESYNDSERTTDAAIEAPKEVTKPTLVAWMTVRRVRYAALAAATLLFLFNYNTLINWIKPRVSNPNMVADKPVVTPIEPTLSVVPVTPVPPTATVAVPLQQKPKETLPILKNATPDMHTETTAVPQELPTKVGSSESNDSIFLPPQIKDVVVAKTPLDGSTIALENLYDFNGLIAKHLAEIDCKNYTLSFVIKMDGTVESPKLEKGDKNCETALFNQIKTMPILKKPIYDGKAVDYRYFFIKN